MENKSQTPASFSLQARALMSKKFIVLKRSWFSTALHFICMAMALFSYAYFEKNLLSFQTQLQEAHGSETPIKRPALVNIPRPEFRAVQKRTNIIWDPNYISDLPRDTCRKKGTCPVVILFTGTNRTTAEKLGENIFGGEILTNSSKPVDLYTAASKFIIGTYTAAPGMDDDSHLYIIQKTCKRNFVFKVSMEINGYSVTEDVKCVKGLLLWRENHADIVRELSNGDSTDKNSEKIPNEFFGAYDFLNTNETTFNITVWYNETKDDRMSLLRAVNVASNAYLKYIRSNNTQILLEFVKSLPVKDVTKTINYFAGQLSVIQQSLFMWLITSLSPVILHSLVSEKENKLRMIMKMNGLRDSPYWLITYAYFLLLSSAYIVVFQLVGFLLGLKLFVLNDVSAQFVFFFAYINVQIALDIMLSTMFSTVRYASAIETIYNIGSGIIAINFNGIPKSSLAMKSLQGIPVIALYDILCKFTSWSEEAQSSGDTRSTWSKIIDNKDGLLTTLLIMTIECAVFLLVGYYVEQVRGSSSGVSKHPLCFFPWFQRRSNIYEQRLGHERLVSNLEMSDVSQEAEKVKCLLHDSDQSHKIIIDNLKTTCPQRDGNPVKRADRGLSLAIPEGECFGFIGRNGAGKSSFISTMTDLTTPTSGTIFVEGLDLRKDMDAVYAKIGVCPQHNLLFEELTGREHLNFYGMLKGLTEATLTSEVGDLLTRVKLSEKCNTVVKRYNEDMKRRLSVAISLIGYPKAVYMDEPSTGLDLASRKSFWRAVEHAKKNKAIILTTHSIEEAEILCDRVGIIVDGSLQCIGSPTELKERYGAYFSLTITTPINQEEEVEKLIHALCPTATKMNHIAGTQKYHLPKQDATFANIFTNVQHAKGRINIQDWCLDTATLEDAFIKVVNDTQCSY